jgi:hypothetical protein
MLPKGVQQFAVQHTLVAQILTPPRAVTFRVELIGDIAAALNEQLGELLFSHPGRLEANNDCFAHLDAYWHRRGAALGM